MSRSKIAKAKKYLEVIRRAVDLVEEILEEDDELDLEQLLPLFTNKRKLKPKYKKTQLKKIALQEPIDQYDEVEQKIENLEEHLEIIDPKRKEYIDEIMSIEDWPEAVPSYLNASPSEEDQINRANAVLDSTISNLNNVNFLDFGCGDGWITKQATYRGVASATGFDLLKSELWKENAENVKFTNVFKQLQTNYYDVVLLYDVLDHCENVMEVMKQVRSVVSKEGVVYVRCHPWTCKHASHLYKKGLNKAYIHLFLKWSELCDLGYTPLFTRNELKPLESYRHWFKNNKFKIVRESVISEPVVDFFNRKDIQEYLNIEQNLTSSEDFASLYQDMSINFVDFELVPM